MSKITSWIGTGIRSFSLWLIYSVALQYGASSLSLAQDSLTPASIPVEKFAQLAVMRDVALSPSGSHLAYIRPLNGRTHLIIQDIESNNTPSIIPPTDDMNFEWLHWANDDRLVFLVSASRKRDLIETRETRLWAIDKDGKNAAHIVRPSTRMRNGTRLPRDLAPAQLQGDVLHWLPEEPNHILVAVDGNHDGAYEVRKIDVLDGEFDEIHEGIEGVQNWLTDQKGELQLGWGFHGQRRYLTYKAANGNWGSAKNSSWNDADFFPHGFSETSNVAYMFGPDESGYTVVYCVDIQSGEFLDLVFQKDGIDAEGLVRDPLTGQPAGVSYTDDLRRVEYFDESLDALQRRINNALPNSANHIASMTTDRRLVLIRTIGDRDPGTFAYLDQDDGRMTLLTEVMPGLDPELMSPVEFVSYAARDGLTIPAYITYPLGVPRQNMKFVVMPHGGPSSRDDRSFSYLAQFIASRGYAVFQPNFRGSTGYGQAFELAGKKEWGGKMQQDVADGTRWLIAQGLADATQICIVGWSYGGYAAAMGAVQTPDMFRCAASINGVLDLPRLIADDRKYIGGSSWTKHMGLEDEKAKNVSPYHQAEHIQVPMLIVQAKDDARVHEDQGKRMAKRLKKLDKPFVYVEVELGGHSMTNESARAQVLSSLEQFLAANLGENRQASLRD